MQEEPPSVVATPEESTPADQPVAATPDESATTAETPAVSEPQEEVIAPQAVVTNARNSITQLRANLRGGNRLRGGL